MLSSSLEEIVYSKFKILPLRSKLVIYSRLIYGDGLKIFDNDVLGLSKKLAGKIFRNFIQEIREETDGENLTAAD